MRRCELERALQGYSIGYSAGSHEYTLKVDILAQGPWRREWNAFDAVQEGSGEGGRAPVPRGASSAEADSNDAYAGSSAPVLIFSGFAAGRVRQRLSHLRCRVPARCTVWVRVDVRSGIVG